MVLDRVRSLFDPTAPLTRRARSDFLYVREAWEQCGLSKLDPRAVAISAMRPAVERRKVKYTPHCLVDMAEALVRDSGLFVPPPDLPPAMMMNAKVRIELERWSHAWHEVLHRADETLDLLSDTVEAVDYEILSGLCDHVFMAE